MANVMRPWRAGQAVAWRVRVRPEGSSGDGVTLVTARLVVHDRPDEVAVFIAPGYPGKRRNSERGGLPSHNHRPVTAWLDGWTDRRWHTYRLLTLKRPSDAHSISLSWRDDTGAFNGWYVDLTSPI